VTFMWCKHCQQVLTAVTRSDGTLICSSCAQPMTRQNTGRERRWHTEPSPIDAGQDESWAGQEQRTSTSSTELAAQWSTAGFLPYSTGTLREDGTRWRVDPVIPLASTEQKPRSNSRIPGPETADTTEPSASPLSSPRMRRPIARSQYLDAAHGVHPPRPAAGRHAHTAAWWFFVVGMHVVVAGAVWTVIDAWGGIGGADTSRRAAALGFYTIGQVVSLGCMGYLVLRLQSQWHKTHGFVRSLTQRLNGFVAQNHQHPWTRSVPPTAPPQSGDNSVDRSMEPAMRLDEVMHSVPWSNLSQRSQT